MSDSERPSRFAARKARVAPRRNTKRLSKEDIIKESASGKHKVGDYSEAIEGWGQSPRHGRPPLFDTTKEQKDAIIRWRDLVLKVYQLSGGALVMGQTRRIVTARRAWIYACVKESGVPEWQVGDVVALATGEVKRHVRKFEVILKRPLQRAIYTKLQEAGAKEGLTQDEE